MRRGAGIGALQKRTQVQQRYESLGTELEAANEASMKQQLDVFQSNLSEFASKHKDKINQNPIFRAQFNKMCSSIGVDPLASNKGFWAQALGVGDFYYQLAVQIIEVCLVTRAENGGLIAVAELLRRLRLLRGRRAALNRSQQASTHARSSGSAGGPDTSAIAASDIYTAVDKVKILGNGFRVVQVAGAPMLLSVPTELSTDTVAVMSHARAGGGRVSAPGAARALGWETARAVRALDGLLREGMGWLDAQDAEQAHWLPSVWQANQHAAEAAEADAADAAAAAAAGAPE